MVTGSCHQRLVFSEDTKETYSSQADIQLPKYFHPYLYDLCSIDTSDFGHTEYPNGYRTDVAGYRSDKSFGVSIDFLTLGFQMLQCHAINTVDIPKG